MCTRIQKKGAVTPQETQTFHECPRVSGGALVQQWPAVKVGALKEVAIIFLAAAAAAAKSLQSCPTLCNPMDCSLSGSSVHWASPGKNTGVGCHAVPSGDLPNPGIEPSSPTLQDNSLPSEPPGKPQVYLAAAAAKSLQSCLTLCSPIHGSPPGSPIPGILQARTLEWVAISFSNA